ncbi:hypothetical protein CPB83DRAFT_75132 [Crepidotus variabilis]|uniref:Lysine-specific metallo-endopeptidase domain-containing protein n=1 Tax=Crepidotus variabilis TaxID=179855 RepID=A0A9P6E5E4_9AGAR|nr:hypothetical protein CPB83DRAFT_75132 [Crepidotus variabilis]
MFSTRLLPLIISALGVLAAPRLHQGDRVNPFNSSTFASYRTSADQVPMTSPSILVYSGCSPVNNQILDDVRAQFVLLSRGAKKWYDAITAPGVDPAVQRDAQKMHAFWFGNFVGDPKWLRWNNILITQVYKNAVQGWNDNYNANPTPANPTASPLNFDCEPIRPGGCEADFFAYTAGGDHLVHICPHFFDAPPVNWNVLVSQEERMAAGTMAHEITHSRYLIGVFDVGGIEQPWTTDRNVGYGWDNCRNAAKTDPLNAMLNADNYKFYFQRSFYQYCQCSPYEGTRDTAPAASEKRQICGAFWAAVPKGSKCTIL